MDRLSTLLAQFSLRAGVFYTGNICGVHAFDRDTVQGHIHVVRRGPVWLTAEGAPAIAISEPSLLFLPRPEDHRLVADEHAGADVVCATVRFGGGGANPISDSLPSVVNVELAAMPGVDALLDLMFDEAFGARCGRQAALDRLCEVLMIRVLRHCMDHGLARSGALAGLADTRLAKALTAVHDDPAHSWDLPAMAALAGMSRARFAVRFKEVTGQTPADYLTSWRILTAQRLLRRGVPLKHVAYDVGYGGASAFARAFARKTGCSPSEWLGRDVGDPQFG